MIPVNEYRTHSCGELRVNHVNLNVRAAGWVESVRDHGGVLFMDLRDFYGVVQVVLQDETMLKGITRESVVSVFGPVRLRDEETVNPKIATGEVEIAAQSVTLLGRAKNILPFEILSSRETREDTRLKYRYLDLRNPKVRDNILLRSRVIAAMRRKMEELGFWEIQTPILTASSPEGARDYLIPSRKHRGQFYALPQAPQIFKQLLMVSGFDRYFQIAPCFRDEDARADRSPGEFYQLDFEMAFAGQEEVFSVAEEVLSHIFSSFSDKTVSPAPFRRIPYEQAMLRYGTDKPDLRNPLEIVDLSDLFVESAFAPFRGRCVRGLRVPGAASRPKSFFEQMEAFALSIGMKGLGYFKVNGDRTYSGPIDKFLTPDSRGEIARRAGLVPGDVIYFIADTAAAAPRLAGEIRTQAARRLGLIDEGRFELCFITDFPMYEPDEQTGAPAFTHNPFSMPQGGLEALNGKSPFEVLAYQYDIVCNGVELSSGAVRNHDLPTMVRAFEIAGYSEEVLREKFPSLYTAFQYGAPPHAGMAPGIDRIVMLLSGEESIREVIPFPMNSAAEDLMMGAPGAVSESQLREVHIKLR